MLTKTEEIIMTMHLWGWSSWFCPVMEWNDAEGRYVVAD